MLSPTTTTAKGGEMSLREIQQPIKEQYRGDPAAARITLRAAGTQLEGARSGSLEIGRAV
jgi:alpha-D-ribose 1-methylphosphonate 5-triphosphate synthase subunit PhnI